MDISLLNLFWGEMLGTMVLIMLGNGIGANSAFKNSIGSKAGWLAVSFGWGLAVFAGVLIAGIFGAEGHLNPAVSIATWTAGTMSTEQFFVAASSQLAGAIIGQVLLDFLNWKHIIDEEPETIIGIHSTGPTHGKAWIRNFTYEVAATMILVSVALMALDKGSLRGNDLSPGIGALSVAFVVFSLVLSMGGSTGASLNPVRDFGPRIVYTVMYRGIIKKPAKCNWSYAWIPTMAPFTAGVIIGAVSRVYF